VFVLKTNVCVTMALQQRAQHAQPMVLTFVRLVPVIITKPATHALGALRVPLEKDKRLLALRHRIVFVLKTIVLVTMALQQRAQHVLPMMLIFVRLVPVDITKLATPALNAPVVYRANTNQEHRAVAVVVPIHKVVLLVQTVVRRISVERAYSKQEQRAVAVAVVIPKRVVATLLVLSSMVSRARPWIVKPSQI
jgi:hypothetical protein